MTAEHNNLVKNFDLLKRGDVALEGGKNSSFGEMISALGAEGVSVPPGFATTSNAYWQFIKHNNIREMMTSLFAELRADTANLVETGHAVPSLIMHGTWSAEVAATIRQSYRELSARAGIET